MVHTHCLSFLIYAVGIIISSIAGSLRWVVGVEDLSGGGGILQTQ